MSTEFKKMPWLVALTAVLLLASVGCANPAADAPDATVSEPSAEPAAVPAGGGDAVVYTLAEGSSVGFVGSKVTGSHDGGFSTFSGEIHVVDGNPVGSHVKVDIDATSLWADNEKLTGHLKSPDFFDVATFPTATFESTEIADAGDGTYTVTGNLTLHGVTRQIAFPATITVGEGEVTANAEFSVKRFDFDIVYPGKADDLIRDEVLVKLDLKGTPAAAADEASGEADGGEVGSGEPTA